MKSYSKEKTKGSMANYQVLEELGSGSYGRVYRIKSLLDQKEYALKRIDESNIPSNYDTIVQAQLLNKVSSQYILRIYDHFKHKQYYCFILELCKGGDLDRLVQETKGLIEQGFIWRVFLQTLIGLADLHQKQIVHRDIKAENILLTQHKEVRIADLGVAKEMKENLTRTMIGTPYYLPPQLCKQKPAYDKKVDIWSLGCVLYRLCTKRYPFEALNEPSLKKKILNEGYKPIPSSYSNEIKNVIEFCLTKNPSLRPSALELISHKIIQDKIGALEIMTEPSTQPLPRVQSKGKLIPTTNKSVSREKLQTPRVAKKPQVKKPQVKKPQVKKPDTKVPLKRQTSKGKLITKTPSITTPPKKKVETKKEEVVEVDPPTPGKWGEKKGIRKNPSLEGAQNIFKIKTPPTQKQMEKESVSQETQNTAEVGEKCDQDEDEPFVDEYQCEDEQPSLEDQQRVQNERRELQSELRDAKRRQGELRESLKAKQASILKVLSREKYEQIKRVVNGGNEQDIKSTFSKDEPCMTPSVVASIYSMLKYEARVSDWVDRQRQLQAKLEKLN